jgi:GTP-binding protein
VAGLKGAVAYLSSSFSTKVLADASKIRNVAIVAHVDHGKTTLVDRLLSSSSGEEEFDATATGESERVMDSMDLEKERGITICSKTTRVHWKGYTINIVDTPGHADFGGEVERILTMVDSVVLVCDATEGPMAQTKFVLTKALERGLRPMAVINKVDRDTARLDGAVESELFDLFAALDATDEQLDYPTLFASAIKNWVTDDLSQAQGWVEKPDEISYGMGQLLDAIVDHVPPPVLDDTQGAIDAPFALAVNNIGRDAYVGRLAMGKIASGTVTVGDQIRCVVRGTENDGQGGGSAKAEKVTGMFVTKGTLREPVPDATKAGPGDIVTISGIECNVGDTITQFDGGVRSALETPPLTPPTVSMTFSANTSPLQGKEGKIVTASKIKERLLFETDNNITITVVPQGEKCEVFARGELQLGILIEQMRREGFEFCVSPPRIVMDGDLEPFLEVVVDVDSEYSGVVINGMTGPRKGALVEMTENPSDGRARLMFHAPARGLLGFGSEIATATRGSAILNHLFLEMQPHCGPLGEDLAKGKLVSTESGKASSYALAMCEKRGELFIEPGTEVYEGMVIGENAKSGDLDINPCKYKQLTNFRTVSKDEQVKLVPPVVRTVEEYISYMGDDEMLEVTPVSIRLRKSTLGLDERFRERRAKKQMKQKFA